MGDGSRSQNQAGATCDEGFFGSGKTSDDRCEGAYIGYVTEYMEEAGAARTEKDKSEYAREESNLRTRLRRPALYPLSYWRIGEATARLYHKKTSMTRVTKTQRH